MFAVKIIPHILAWAGIVLILFRGSPGQRPAVTLASISGFVAGSSGAFILFRFFPEPVVFGVIKSVLGVSFLLLWGVAVAALYLCSSARVVAVQQEGKSGMSSLWTGVIAGAASLVAGAICASRLPGRDSTVLEVVLLVLAAAALAYVVVYAVRAVEKLLSASFIVSKLGLLTIVIALLLFSASSILRLDLFSPLSMKVMKGIHDFVHQFMESILIPDHLFVRSAVWGYIGLLFSKEVGFWGGMVIWFVPAILIILATRFKRLPSVAHIRQGAQRRKLLAASIGLRRGQIVVPVIALVVFATAAYQSRFPNVEYWDPKPVPVSANQAGEIFIPKKGDVNLEDGKLHKYLFKQGEREARFFVLMSPAGVLTVDLDACAICKPDGYGQAEGTVICYYCKTLIPLETVGKPGGCNPVPVPFTEKDGAVVIDGMTLINSWSSTVKATAGNKEGGK